ncbi:glycoside hydrolase [Paenibacillus sp. GSMTC-2017]|uniref:glycoside hydrolase n=1 Tax=Paenibacillus sp. GSMTC-2017 TaxID=2794350 RepID=UPI0018D6A625|nr:glycoside hydrolase [Paenibacillus sp. GSMTC-2017]
MERTIILSLVVIILFGVLSGCGEGKITENQVEVKVNPTEKVVTKNFSFSVKPETFEITINKDGIKEQAAIPIPASKVTDYKKDAQKVQWSYSEHKVKVNIEKKPTYLDITIQSTGADHFQWPKVNAVSYMLPMWEGKFIPSNDSNWKMFLKEEEISWSETFSMNFFALNKASYSLVYILKNAFNNDVTFDTEKDIQLQFSHEFPSVNLDKTYGFRLYVTDNDATQIAGLYKQEVEAKSGIVTLDEKAESNPEIKKLYGAPHIYLWNNDLITSLDMDWDKWMKTLESPFYPRLSQLLEQHTEDGASEFNQVLNEVTKQSYLDKYQKSVIVRAFNQALKLEQLYDSNIFKPIDEATQKLISKGISNLSEQKLYELNKMLIKSILKDAIRPIDQWGKENSSEIIDEMKQLNINNAWIGLPNWSNGLMNPTFVEQAEQAGYLIAPYDSYHSIHKKENKDWNTAYFGDNNLYEQATILNKKGEYVKGFLGRGRKLNPTLSLPIVKDRLQIILQDGITYNSWFVDADATGEVYDDYSREHPTIQEQDMKARLERMAYIANEKGMVVGSETGNDFASGTIAYAHGLETPVIKWSDPDMRKNKTSQYYVGGYYSPTGGIPERYRKQVPIKDLYKKIYIDPTYSLPLYKLVYNNSVITTHHWEWGSYKIKDAVVERMMMEFLYNVPPLYHLDGQEWEKDKKRIAAYLKDWTPFHQKAVTRPMTGFHTLTPDRLVQKTNFGSDMKVIANFSDSDYKDDQGTTIKPQSIVIYEGRIKKALDLAAI